MNGDRMINENDIVELDLIVKDINTKLILDTTYEDLAKKEGIYSEKITYGPLKAIFGKGELLSSVEKNIKDLEKDKQITFSLKKEEAFGERDPKKTKLIPMSDFKKENIKPVPGMHLNFGDTTGKIISISGGRIMVDLNHDFAGKDLEYTITIKNIYSSDEEKVNGLLKKFFYFIPEDKLQKNLTENKVEIILPPGLPKETDYLKDMLSRYLFDITKYEELKFSEVYKKLQEKQN